MYIAIDLKKLAAILLIALFTFNLFGYRILFYFAQQQSDTNIEKSFDGNQYNEQDLVTLKIPISVPYQVEQRDFERFDGEINLNGRIYKYVKRKVSGGNIVLLCLPDQNKMKLEAVKNDCVKNSSDLQNTASKKSGSSKPATAKNITSDYQQTANSYRIAVFRSIRSYHFTEAASSLPTALHLSPEQPPESV
jgi:hypothetical protein